MTAFASKPWEKSKWRNRWKKKNKVCLSTCQTGTELVKTAIWERNALKVIECFPNIWYVKFNDLRSSVLYRCTKVGYFTKRTLWTALTLKTVKTGRRSSTVYPSDYLSGWRLREISKWCYSVFRFCTLAHSKADIIKFKSGCLAFVVLRFIHPLSKWTFIPKVRNITTYNGKVELPNTWKSFNTICECKFILWKDCNAECLELILMQWKSFQRRFKKHRSLRTTLN